MKTEQQTKSLDFYQTSFEEVFKFKSGIVFYDAIGSMLYLVHTDILFQHFRAVQSVDMDAVEKVSVYEKDICITVTTGIRMLRMDGYDSMQEAATKLQEIFGDKVVFAQSNSPTLGASDVAFNRYDDRLILRRSSSNRKRRKNKAAQSYYSACIVKAMGNHSSQLIQRYLSGRRKVQ